MQNPLGMTYVIRFMKDWDSTTDFYGEKLPLRFDGPNTIPWGRPTDPHPCPRRQAMLEHIQYASTSCGGMSLYDCEHPEEEGSDLINSFLTSIGATQGLHHDDALKGGKTQRVTSHSLRKAGVALAIASGVSQENVRRWTRWRNPEMLWQYAPIDYNSSPDWHSLFGWMKTLAAQNARAS